MFMNPRKILKSILFTSINHFKKQLLSNIYIANVQFKILKIGFYDIVY